MKVFSFSVHCSSKTVSLFEQATLAKNNKEVEKAEDLYIHFLNSAYPCSNGPKAQTHEIKFKIQEAENFLISFLFLTLEKYKEILSQMKPILSEHLFSTSPILTGKKYNPFSRLNVAGLKIILERLDKTFPKEFTVYFLNLLKNKNPTTISSAYSFFLNNWKDSIYFKENQDSLCPSVLLENEKHQTMETIDLFQFSKKLFLFDSNSLGNTENENDFKKIFYLMSDYSQPLNS